MRAYLVFWIDFVGCCWRKNIFREKIGIFEGVGEGWEGVWLKFNKFFIFLVWIVVKMREFLIFFLVISTIWIRFGHFFKFYFLFFQILGHTLVLLRVLRAPQIFSNPYFFNFFYPDWKIHWSCKNRPSKGILLDAKWSTETLIMATTDLHLYKRQSPDVHHPQHNN